MSKSDRFQVSNSKISLWRRCRQAYDYKYVQKLRKKTKSRPLQFGTMVHEMLDAWANGNDPFELLEDMRKKQGKLFRQQIEEFGDIVEDVRVIMTEYFQFWEEQGDIDYQKIDGSWAEHRFEIELRNGVFLVGKIDGKAKAKRLSWLVEHKSFNQMPNEDHRWRNLQSGIYTRVNDILGWKPVDGMLWDYIWSKPPSEPKLLKNGDLSKRGINTLPLRVLETLERLELDPSKFRDLMKFAKGTRKSYFVRIFNPTKKRVVDMLWDDMIETVEEMVELHGKRSARSIDRHCMWCDFEPLCRAALTGSDVDYIKEKEYYVDKTDHSKEWADAAFGEE